jgi:hypothetical protein
VEHGVPNNGLLLELADGEENFVSGPKLPSSEFANATLLDYRGIAVDAP